MDTARTSPIRPGLPSPSASEVRRRRALAAVGLTVLLVMAGIVGYAIFTYVSIGSKLAPEPEERAEIEAVLDKPSRSTAESGEPDCTYILLLGNDRRSGQVRARSDTIILARLSNTDRSVVLVSIPRDTRTEVPGHGITKINHASAYGGVPLTIETVKRFTGLPVHHYMEVDFDGFKTVVDMLGGIEMHVDRPVDYGQGIVVDTGMQHLDGRKALAVVRNRRAYADGDFGRVRNQQAFLSAIARKASSPGNLDRLPRILSESAGRVKTDLSVAEIVNLMRIYRNTLQDDLPGYTVPGAPAMVGGVSYVITDEAAASALFESLARGETPDR